MLEYPLLREKIRPESVDHSYVQSQVSKVPVVLENPNQFPIRGSPLRGDRKLVIRGQRMEVDAVYLARVDSYHHRFEKRGYYMHIKPGFGKAKANLDTLPAVK